MSGPWLKALPPAAMLPPVNQSGLSKYSRLWICSLLVLILAFNFFIRWRLRDMPLERDEGEYAYAGQLILQGIPPYQLACNMKFPGVYFAYALLMAVFGQTTAGIHLGIILVTSVTAILVFLIGFELFSAAGGLLAAAMFVCFAALPKAAGLAGHATHFVSLFVCAGVFALLTAQKKKSPSWWLASGLAFGLAILMKQHALLFPAFILAWLFWKEFRRDQPPPFWRHALVFCAGCVIPLAATAIGFACAGLWGQFTFWTMEYASRYASILPLRAAPGQFVAGFVPVFETSTWAWLAGLAGLFCVWQKKLWDGPAELAAVLFLAALAAACPGFYFRNHYFLMAMPGLALLAAALILTVARTLKNSGSARWSIWLPACVAGLILGNLFAINGAIWFEKSPLAATCALYGASPFPEAAPLADYLEKNTSPTDTLAILGSEPEIFFLSHRHSASGYLYLYSLTEPQPLAPQMRQEFTHQIEAARPKYVIFENIFSAWYSVILPQSFQAAAEIQDWWGNYSTNYTLAGAVKIFPDKPSEFILERTVAQPFRHHER